jgi:excinuclease ABC subunit A
MQPEAIIVRGAHEHNLSIDLLAIPKFRLVVFTGVSGSGKSSLAFDTLYAEGQRRYVESLSAYARQFLGQMEKPKVEKIGGLSPTIAIEQKSASGNPRSTVGTITEIYDYLRVLYARIGEQRCHLCGRSVRPQTTENVVETILEQPASSRWLVAAPIAENRKGEFKDVFADLARRGFARVRVDGEVLRLEEGLALDKKKKHDVALVVDRLAVGKIDRARLTDSVETALREGKGTALAIPDGDGEPIRFSQARACPVDGIGFPELTPQSFSFNSPLGMCIDCNGLGTRLEMDPDLVVPDSSKSIRQGAIVPWASAVANESGWLFRIIRAVERDLRIDLDMPWAKLPASQKETLLYGAGEKRVRVKWDGAHSAGSWAMRFEGILNTLMRRFEQTRSEGTRQYYRRYLREAACRACKGARLRPEARAVLVAGLSIVETTQMTVAQAADHFASLALGGADAKIADEVLKEVRGRLEFLRAVGLEYLTLDRAGPSLSGGEAQRIRLASQLGSELSGVLYVLDEPSIGLHQRDNRRLLDTLRRLRDLGNTVLVVEHDAEAIQTADHVVDFGPGAGRDGGKVVFEGPPAALLSSDSLTGRYLSGRASVAPTRNRREPIGWLGVEGAAENNLKGIDVRFPLGALVTVAGVSGAGKSSLVRGILYPALMRAVYRSYDHRVGKHTKLVGADQIDKVIHIDQQPIGRTPRSNPATYTKAFDVIRDLFSQTPDARAAGFLPGRFSFNVRGGRCETCEGDGVIKVEMHFLADVYVTCEACRGKRYNDATLRVLYKGRTIADVLDTTVAEALEVFAAVPPLRRILETLAEVGLDYVALGQPAPTLSGGEAQRVKLSRELAKRETGRTFYLLDEPTTGLHFDDVRKLLVVLHRLVDAGNTVVVIEHNLDVIRSADWVIDLGPEGGDAGGRVVAEGTPEAVAKVGASHTGRWLRDPVDSRADAPRPRIRAAAASAALRRM